MRDARNAQHLTLKLNMPVLIHRMCPIQCQLSTWMGLICAATASWNSSGGSCCNTVLPIIFPLWRCQNRVCDPSCFYLIELSNLRSEKFLKNRFERNGSQPCGLSLWTFQHRRKFSRTLYPALFDIPALWHSDINDFGRTLTELGQLSP